VKNLRTSKLLLLLWILAGGVLLFVADVTLYVLILWMAGLVSLMWNRIDSRARAYAFTFRGPQGVSVTLSTDGDGEAEEPKKEPGKETEE
jgi:hypothetical protein